MNVSENLFSPPSLHPNNLMNFNTDYSHSPSPSPFLSPSSSSTDSLPSSTQEPQFENNQPQFSPSTTNTYTYYDPPPSPPRLPQIHHRRKRTKTLRVGDSSTSTSLSLSLTKPISKRKAPGKKPSSNAPLITHPCTECGKKFWSWKALFGHMRCHPERQWRGIKPPPNFRHQIGFTENAGPSSRGVNYTEEEHEVAQCLLMLASGSSPSAAGEVDYYSEYVNDGKDSLLSRAIVVHDPNRAIMVHDPGPSSSSYQFECSGCKKVFGSHQALGGHRASHKNTKGCFAITTRNERSSGDVLHEVFDERGGGDEGGGDGMKVVDRGLGHKCNICFKVFPSGQALGGHMRCHWEKGEGTSSQQQQGVNTPASTSRDGFLLDLNVPAPGETGGSSSSSSSGLALDLHLGI